MGTLTTGTDLRAQLPASSETPVLRLSLEEAVSRALEANPNLRAQRATADVAAQMPLQATPAFLPSLTLGLQGMRRRRTRPFPRADWPTGTGPS